MEDVSFQVSEMVVDLEEQNREAILKAQKELNPEELYDEESLSCWFADYKIEEKSDMEKWWERGIPKNTEKWTNWKNVPPKTVNSNSN